MPTYYLMPHPDHPPLAVRGVEVEVLGSHDGILLTYRIIGHDRVVTSAWQTPTRADELWRTTCFELFLRVADAGRYVEFNFSPSTRWAAYSFSDYRVGMTPLPRDVEPFVERREDGVEVDCDLGGLPRSRLAMGLSAVIEEVDGTKSYWALAHAVGPPDFHNPACFLTTLPAPASP